MNTRRVRFQKGQAEEVSPTEDTLPHRRAVAIGYDPGSDLAPRVLASGKGYVAEQILALAQQNGIPVREDPALAAALAMVDVEQMIPPELYTLVAEVLAFVYRLRHEQPNQSS